MARRIPSKTRNRVSREEFAQRIDDLETEVHSLRNLAQTEIIERQSLSSALVSIREVLGYDISKFTERELKILQLLHNCNTLKIEIKPGTYDHTDKDYKWTTWVRP